MDFNVKPPPKRTATLRPAPVSRALPWASTSMRKTRFSGLGVIPARNTDAGMRAGPVAADPVVELSATNVSADVQQDASVRVPNEESVSVRSDVGRHSNLPRNVVSSWPLSQLSVARLKTVPR